MRGKVRKSNNIVKKILAICFVATLMIIAFLATCRVKNVIFEGNTRYSQEALEAKLITKVTDQNSILFYLHYKYGEKVSIPFVEDIDVMLVDKNTVKVHVYEKAITGCLEYMSGYMYFDKDGIVVESSKEKLTNVPIITGLKFDKFVLFEKLEIDQNNIFPIILNLTQLIQKYELNIEKIDFNSDLEVTLYQDDIKILLGKRDAYDEQLAELKNLLPSAKGQKIIFYMENFAVGQDKIIAKPLN